MTGKKKTLGRVLSSKSGIGSKICYKRVNKGQDTNRSYPNENCAWLPPPPSIFLMRGAMISVPFVLTDHFELGLSQTGYGYLSGAPNDDFLLNTLKTFFRLSRVVLDF